MKPIFVRIFAENPYLMLSVTFHPVCIASNRRKDGTYPVRIRVTFKGVSRRLPTNLTARASDLTRSLHIKSPDLLNKSAALIAGMRETLVDISPFTMEDWDVDAVVAHIRASMHAESFRLDFFAFADEYVKTKTPATRRSYVTALNELERFVGERRLDINEISRPFLAEFREAVDGRRKVTFTGGKFRETDKPQKGGQSARMLAKLENIHNAAKARYNDEDSGRILIPRSPFAGLPKGTPPPQGQRNLGAELMQRIVDAEAEGLERVALDAFVLSFCTMGANMADLWAARPVGTIWVYNRQKTKSRRQDRAEMRVTVPPQARVFVERLRGRGPWWLNDLHRVGGTKDICTGKVNAALKSWAERNGVEPFTFYAARKSWASIARSRDVGIEKARVDECLCHVGDFRMTDIYAERDYAAMDEANAKVLATLRFPG